MNEPLVLVHCEKDNAQLLKLELEHSLMSLQLTPSPVNPGPQPQKNDPTVLVHPDPPTGHP
jgi:hypothetical protein